MSGSLPFTIQYHRRVGSTSDIARELARDGAPEGTAVVATEQTQGRGRGGRDWHSPPGSGLYVSLILRPSLAPDRLPRLMILAAVAVARAVAVVTAAPALIKWPNDVWIRGRKVAGILAEGGTPGAGMPWAVIGIGINTGPSTFPPPLDQTATCLSREAGRRVDRGQVLDEVLRQLSDLYVGWREGGWAEEAWDGVIDAYRSLCLTPGRDVAVAGKTEYRARALDVDRDGALTVLLPGGMVRRVLAEDVSLCMDNNQIGDRGDTPPRE